MEVKCGNCRCKYCFRVGCRLEKITLDGDGICQCFELSPDVAVRDYLDSLPQDTPLALRSGQK